mmetsp:Transcript_4975/g.10353  ORF Transcript_4975/g.10353 Transcript_4975/m.10353 type:complete len:368 (+) Transcript_4975:617-1720(+)
MQHKSKDLRKTFTRLTDKLGSMASLKVSSTPAASASATPEPRDLSDVRSALRRIMWSPGHDDGSYAPLFIRFSWHMCGTYCKDSGNGGSWGGTYRFENEVNDPENAGLTKARDLLDQIKRRFEWLSYADLYVLAGTVAIEYAGGPYIPLKTGRPDYDDAAAEKVYGTGKCPFGYGDINPNTSRLPAADLGPDPNVPSDAPVQEREAPTINAVRRTFHRMGFSDKEAVCLILLGHQFGRCHLENSGYQHAWYAFAPHEWNAYESGLGYMSLYGNAINRFKEVTTPAGKRQFELFFAGRRWMMLPADMALYWDPEFYEHVMFYDENRRTFKEDAIAAWTKLMELGCDQSKLIPELEPVAPQPPVRRYYH